MLVNPAQRTEYTRFDRAPSDAMMPLILFYSSRLCIKVRTYINGLYTTNLTLKTVNVRTTTRNVEFSEMNTCSM